MDGRLIIKMLDVKRLTSQSERERIQMGSKNMQTLNEYVAEQIRNKIISHEYSAGSKLPNEFELAEEYGVCRYTIREAIKKLAATGLIEVRRGKGTFVNEMIPSNYIQPMMDKLILEERDIREIFEVRIALESKSASLAARNAAKEEIRGMEDILACMEGALENNDIQQYNNLDFKFHSLVATAGKNRLLCEIENFLQDFIRYTIEESAINMEKHRRSLEGHYGILDAIREKNPEMAEKEMEMHLQFCRGLY